MNISIETPYPIYIVGLLTKFSVNLSTDEGNALCQQISILKGALQSVCKQSLCLHFCVQNIELYSTTVYIFKLLGYNELSRNNNQALQERKT
jgi:hypothetical protein